MHVAGGHQIEPLAGESDHFGFNRRAVGGHHFTTITDGGLAAEGFEGETDHARELAFHRRRWHFGRHPQRAGQLVAPWNRLADGLTHAPPVRGCTRSSPSTAVSASLRRVSTRASTCVWSVCTRQSPRSSI